MDINRKRLLVLIFGLLLLGFSYVTLKYVPSFFTQPKALFPFTTESITRLSIIGNQKQQSITKKNGVWVVLIDEKEFQADSDKVESLLLTLGRMSKSIIVSTNKNKHAVFGIDKEKIIIETENKKQFDLFLGRETSENGRFLRWGKENEIFQAENMASFSANDDFRNLRIHIVSDPSKVGLITIKRQDEAVTLTKQKNEWFIDSAPIQSRLIDYYLQDLTSLTGSDIVEELPETLLNNPFLTVSVLENGKQKVVWFYENSREETSVFVKSDSLSIVYSLPRVYATSLAKTKEDFLEKL